MESVVGQIQWASGKKILFRFVFLFFLLFIAIENNGAYPLWQMIFHYPQEWFHQFIPWVGKYVLQLDNDITIFSNGSGDTTYDWVIVFCIFVTSLTGTVVWSVFDRNLPNYNTLYYWLTVAVRYYVGLMLIQYGLVKVIKLQFPFPSFVRLEETFGESSPMGLAWTFLGFSTGYNLFMGIAEIAAVFLLFRRTMTLGAIITIMTTTNVMAVNYFYDVPVKIISTSLVAMTLFLLMHNARDLFEFFFRGRSISLKIIQLPPFKRYFRLTGIIFKSLLVVNSLGFGFYESITNQKKYNKLMNPVKPPLYGNYQVERYAKGKSTFPIIDSTRWLELKVESEHYAGVKMIYDSTLNFSINADTATHLLYMTQTNADTKFVFKFSEPDSAHLLLKGILKNDSIHIRLKKQNPKKYNLINRGFHWINEYPYNR